MQRNARYRTITAKTFSESGWVEGVFLVWDGRPKTQRQPYPFWIFYWQKTLSTLPDASWNFCSVRLEITSKRTFTCTLHVVKCSQSFQKRSPVLKTVFLGTIRQKSVSLRQFKAILARIGWDPFQRGLELDFRVRGRGREYGSWSKLYMSLILCFAKEIVWDTFGLYASIYRNELSFQKETAAIEFGILNVVDYVRNSFILKISTAL